MNKFLTSLNYTINMPLCPFKFINKVGISQYPLGKPFEEGMNSKSKNSKRIVSILVMYMYTKYRHFTCHLINSLWSFELIYTILRCYLNIHAQKWIHRWKVNTNV